jgi:AtzE family amidohydrolase
VFDPFLVKDRPIDPAPPSGAPVDALSIANACLAEIDTLQPQLNLFTTVFKDRVLEEATRLPDGPLAGVTVAVKDLFDVQGVVTLAGSSIFSTNAPAAADSTVVRRLRRAGALIMGATNMDEFAYGFTTENSHYGPTHNPHDPSRVAGGSSGGSAAAVASGAVRIGIGTDTNGSIRIPAAFCGVLGLRPTLGAIPTDGSVLFAPSLDSVGLLTRSADDLRTVFSVLTNSATMQPEINALRVTRAGGELAQGATPEVLEATERIASALGAVGSLDLPAVGLARAAAIVITAAEGADQHQQLLRTSVDTLDPRTRGRFVAGMGVSATDYLAAQRFRRWWQHLMSSVLGQTDIVVLPTVACPAPLIDQEMIEIEGITLPKGAVLGRFTQPFSLIGLPALSVPVTVDGLPIGVQLVGRPGGEATLIAAATHLEAVGAIRAGRPAISVPPTRKTA